MPLPALHRLLSSFLPGSLPQGWSTRSETRPPLPRAHRFPWLPRLHFERRRSETLAAARLDFAQAIGDLRSRPAHEAQVRIAIARSLHELWHVREEVFSLIACRHDQAEATRRLAGLDRHFAQRGRSVRHAERARGRRDAAP
ncbi:MAG: hypothetical protein ABI699_13555 [Caldimonas sp.]